MQLPCRALVGESWEMSGAERQRPDHKQSSRSEEAEVYPEKLWGVPLYLRNSKEIRFVTC